MGVGNRSNGIRRIALAAALVAATVFTSSLLYNLSEANDWDCEEIASISTIGPLASTVDSEHNLHMLFAGRIEGGESGLIYGISTGEDSEFELVVAGRGSYESLSIAVDSMGGVHASAINIDDNIDHTRFGIYAVKEGGQWRTEVVAPPIWPAYMQTLLIGVVIDSDDRPNLFYYQRSIYLEYYDPVFVWSTISDGGWSNKTMTTENLSYYWLFSTCSDASGRVHFTSWMYDLAAHTSGAAYSVYDGENISSIMLPPSLGGTRPLALDNEDRPFIGLIEDTTGVTRYSIASLQGDAWTLNPIGECTMTWGVDMPCIMFDEAGVMHAVLSRSLHPDNDGNEVMYATRTNGVWTMQRVDLVPDASSWDATLAIDQNDVVRIFYLDRSEYILMSASSEKDDETVMQPYKNAGELALIVTAAFAAVGLTTVSIANRIRKNRLREEAFKKPFDSDKLQD